MTDRHKFKQYLALCVWFQIHDFPNQRVVFARLIANIQMVDDSTAVKKNVEDPRLACTRRLRRTHGGRCRTLGTVLDKMQYDCVFAGRDRDSIREMSPTLSFIELRVVSSRGRLEAAAQLPSLEINVGAPPLAVVGVIGYVPGDNANRAEMPWHCGRNLYSRQHGHAPCGRRKLEVQQAILGRHYARENPDVSGPVASGICQHIEVRQQLSAIGADCHHPAALATTTRLLGSIVGLREVQTQFISALFQGNVVTEVALPAGAVNGGILRAPYKLHRAFDRSATRKKGIGTPELAGVIYIVSAGAG